MQHTRHSNFNRATGVSEMVPTGGSPWHRGRSWIRPLAGTLQKPHCPRNWAAIRRIGRYWA